MFTYQTLPLLTTFNIIQRLKITVYLNYLYKFISTQQKTQSEFVIKTDLLVLFKFDVIVRQYEAHKHNAYAKHDIF
jgi:hypothetical protein